MGLIDLHCDTIWRIFESKTDANLTRNDFHVDIDKLVKANSFAQFFALFIDREEVIKKGKSHVEYCSEMLDRFYTEIENNDDKIRFAGNYEQYIENRNNNKVSAFLTIEGGDALEGKLYNLRNFYRLGVRLITLTWNYDNEIGYPNCNKESMDRGLTDFGKQVVKEMNRLGMIVDVSHLSDGGFYDVAALSDKPFVASHSDARFIQNHFRNLNDDMIKILSEKGGVMGINFCTSFLSNKDISLIEDIIRHIKHIKNVGGIDVISIGSDFDGIGGNIEINNIGEMEKLFISLSKAGFTDDEIERILYKNAERVIRDCLR
ncbi:membrane dipeptidase (peptidase family M19) [Clostridium tepidiprofundi DSM 19306]|uniref:Membrane dipeptidase (Peptidase family M19) n=1 Tax=Clostridium tepidiprofundi DSM 19306 TaxID=1121338 RepID=A0A151B2S3_9CLOT|nr:dipeptidase [Clostridium tepidiprofundi]KYH34205.1 membrane dipeptidase (peptidase family M19) [Clostridium tepidiprofundi DSM 19306]